ncbi:hypothetical protein SLS62_000083 [Diatrype stigma]|uniref:Myb-like domain-containing protein n=1 Tax=Diatrype stigma TaxID=117547 RepID=A0AAN9V3Z1_9PEZI
MADSANENTQAGSAASEKARPWTVVEKHSLLLKIIEQAEASGGLVNLDEIEMPGRTTSAVRRMYSCIKSEAEVFQASFNIDAAAAANAAATAGVTNAVAAAITADADGAAYAALAASAASAAASATSAATLAATIAAGAAAAARLTNTAGAAAAAAATDAAAAAAADAAVVASTADAAVVASTADAAVVASIADAAGAAYAAVAASAVGAASSAGTTDPSVAEAKGAATGDAVSAAISAPEELLTTTNAASKRLRKADALEDGEIGPPAKKQSRPATATPAPDSGGMPPVGNPDWYPRFVAVADNGNGNGNEGRENNRRFWAFRQELADEARGGETLQAQTLAFREMGDRAQAEARAEAAMVRAETQALAGAAGARGEAAEAQAADVRADQGEFKGEDKDELSEISALSDN